MVDPGSTRPCHLVLSDTPCGLTGIPAELRLPRPTGWYHRRYHFRREQQVSRGSHPGVGGIATEPPGSPTPSASLASRRISRYLPACHGPPRPGPGREGREELRCASRGLLRVHRAAAKVRRVPHLMNPSDRPQGTRLSADRDAAAKLPRARQAFSSKASRPGHRRDDAPTPNEPVPLEPSTHAAYPIRRVRREPETRTHVRCYSSTAPQ